MEGRLAEECYGQAKEEGCKVEVVWQDGDSSSSLNVFLNVEDMLAEHMGIILKTWQSSRNLQPA